MSHQKRNRRIVHEFVGHPTEQPLTQGQRTISTHNEEVGLAPFGLRHQLGCDFFAAALDAMQRGVDLKSATKSASSKQSDDQLGRRSVGIAATIETRLS